jgi:Peptidase family M28/PDZ domain/PA domain
VKYRLFVAPILLVGLAAAVPALEREPVVARLRADVTFLASDTCEGRGPGTAGIDKAADHIAAAFKAAGLKCGMPDGSYFQPFVIKGQPELGRDNAVALTVPAGPLPAPALGGEFQPLGVSASGVAEGPVVFVGYAASVPTAHYDDFHGVDVAGKVVLMIRRLPRYGRTDQPFDDQTVQEAAALATKIGNAEQRKAAAVLLCNDASEPEDTLMDFAYSQYGETAGIPTVQVKRSAADRLLREGTGQSLADVEKAIDADLKPRSAPLKGVTVKVTVTIERKPVNVKNIVAVLDGAGPLAGETVVLGAHYDHLGYGSADSLAPGQRAIHHGADDNASGTAALLELARRFAADPPVSRRRLVFIAFSAEEVGLFGSAHYAKQPPFPLADTVAMVNLDMVGRLTDDAATGKSKLEIGGTGTAKEFDALLDRLNAKYGFALKKNTAGMGPSDHTSFYAKGVPVFFFFTGLHRQYHTPADTADLINFAGMVKVTDFVEELARHLATTPTRPTYVKGMTGSMSADTARMSVPRLGFMPGDYGEDAGGVLIASVNKGGPAEKAGLQDNDLIVEVAGRPVKNMGAYMTVIRTQKRGQPVEITVLRKGERVKVTVTPQ